MPPTADTEKTRPTPAGVTCSTRTRKTISIAPIIEPKKLNGLMEHTTLRRIGYLTTSQNPSAISRFIFRPSARSSGTGLRIRNSDTADNAYVAASAQIARAARAARRARHRSTTPAGRETDEPS